MFEWDPDDLDQVQRIVASKEAKLRKGIVKLDRDREAMLIQGSGAEPYFTTLYACTCIDFDRRQQPCKHMYALADELGMLDDFPVCKKTKLDKPAEAERYKKMFLAGDMKAEDYVRICKALWK